MAVGEGADSMSWVVKALRELRGALGCRAKRCK